MPQTVDLPTEYPYGIRETRIMTQDYEMVEFHLSYGLFLNDVRKPRGLYLCTKSTSGFDPTVNAATGQFIVLWKLIGLLPFTTEKLMWPGPQQSATVIR